MRFSLFCGFNAGFIGSYRRFGIAYDPIFESQTLKEEYPSWTDSSLKMAKIGAPETSVTNYKSAVGILLGLLDP
jgi:hypothetical protein